MVSEWSNVYGFGMVSCSWSGNGLMFMVWEWSHVYCLGMFILSCSWSRNDLMFIFLEWSHVHGIGIVLWSLAESDRILHSRLLENVVLTILYFKRLPRCLPWFMWAKVCYLFDWCCQFWFIIRVVYCNNCYKMLNPRNWNPEINNPLVA